MRPGSYKNINRTSEDVKAFFCSSPIFAMQNRSSEDVKIFFCFSPNCGRKRSSEDVKKTVVLFCSSPIFAVENRLSQDVTAFFFALHRLLSNNPARERLRLLTYGAPNEEVAHL